MSEKGGKEKLEVSDREQGSFLGEGRLDGNKSAQIKSAVGGLGFWHLFLRVIIRRKGAVWIVHLRARARKHACTYLDLQHTSEADRLRRFRHRIFNCLTWEWNILAFLIASLTANYNPSHLSVTCVLAKECGVSCVCASVCMHVCVRVFVAFGQWQQVFGACARVRLKAVPSFN